MFFLNIFKRNQSKNTNFKTKNNWILHCLYYLPINKKYFGFNVLDFNIVFF